MAEQITNLLRQVESLQQELLTAQVSAEHGTSCVTEVEEEVPELKVKPREKILEEQLKALNHERDNLEIVMKEAMKENYRLVNQIELTNANLKDKKIADLGGKVAQLECTVSELTEHLQENRVSINALTDEKDISIKSLNEKIRDEASLTEKLRLNNNEKEATLNLLVTEREEKENLIQTFNEQKNKWMECEEELSAQIQVTENKNEALIISSKLLNGRFTENQKELKKSQDQAKTLKEQIVIKEAAIESLQNKLDENEILNESMLRECQNFEKYISFSNVSKWGKLKKLSLNMGFLL